MKLVITWGLTCSDKVLKFFNLCNHTDNYVKTIYYKYVIFAESLDFEIF